MWVLSHPKGFISSFEEKKPLFLSLSLSLVINIEFFLKIRYYNMLLTIKTLTIILTHTNTYIEERRRKKLYCLAARRTAKTSQGHCKNAKALS